MILLDNKDNNQLIKHLQGEIDIALAEGKDIKDIEDIVSAIYPLLNKGYDYDKVRSILSKCINYVDRQLIIPLNLSVGEFRFVKNGLSINTRNPNVFMDTKGIYYKKAYRSKVICAYDSYTDWSISINNIKERTPLIDGIFLMTGGIITNCYFDKVYLHKSTIDKKVFYPSSPILIEVNAYVFKNEYILVARTNNPKVKALFQLYDVPIETYNAIGYENFGITNKINKNELFKKGSSLGV